MEESDCQEIKRSTKEGRIMQNNNYIDNLESVFIDLVVGYSEKKDLSDATGLSPERCAEILSLAPVVEKRYCERHGLHFSQDEFKNIKREKSPHEKISWNKNKIKNTPSGSTFNFRSFAVGIIIVLLAGLLFVQGLLFFEDSNKGRYEAILGDGLRQLIVIDTKTGAIKSPNKKQYSIIKWDVPFDEIYYSTLKN